MRKVIILLILLMIIGGAFYAYHQLKNRKESDHITLFGNVDIRQVDMGFRVPGRVKALYFEEGDLVKPGMLMASLDRQPYADQVRESIASKSSIEASLSNAEKVLKRRQELIQDGSISQEDLDNAFANVEVLSANLKQAHAAYEVAAANLSYTEVFAPTEGTILTRIREPGSVVNAADPVYTLSILSPVWIRAFVSEPYLGRIYPGMEAEIHTDSQGVYKGNIGFISPVAEFTPKTVETTELRTDLVYRLRIYAENPDKGLRQGMPVTVKLQIR